jgi:hypothetical protein
MRRFPWRLGFKVVLVFCLGTAFGLHFIEIADAQAAQPLTALMIEPGVAPGWWVQHADAPLTFNNMPPHSLGVTTNGVVHVVYGGDHLYHAWKSGVSWYYETVDPAWGVGSLAALAIDSTGKLHVSYIDTIANRLKYATNRYGSWQLETPPIADVLSASNAAIAVDSANDPHIVFSSYDNTLRYGYFDNDYGGWVGPETLATGTGLLNYPGAFALAVGTQVATPHVSYHKHVTASNGTLYYTTRTGYDTWSTPLALGLVGVSNGDYNDIALNGNIPHIAASANTPSLELYVVRYTFLDGASWHTAEPATTTYAPATAISLRLVGGIPTIAYQDPGVGYYWLSRTGDNNWSAEEAVVTGAAVGNWASFAWYGSYPYATYYDTSTHQFSFKYKTSGGWQAPYTLATQGPEVGQCTSLAVDSLGRSHISYLDATNHRLLYARYDGGSTWFKNTIDSSGTANCFSVMRINPTTNVPSVGFSTSGGSLYYSRLVSSSWQTNPQAVDTGITGTYQNFGLALDSGGEPRFTYRKGSNLWYAVPNGASWSPASIVSGSVGGYVALALGPSNQPFIAYYQAGVLKHTTFNGSWITETIAASGAGVGVALAVNPADPIGTVVAAYLSNGGNNLAFSSRGLCNPTTHVCSWTSGVIVDALAEENFSLAVDTMGVPHLACFSFTSSGFELHYITKRANSWVVQVVDNGGWVGEYPSIALSPYSGKPRISFQDVTNQDLKFVLQPDRVHLPIMLK